MPGDIFTSLTQVNAPWWAPLLGVVVGGLLGALAAWRAAAMQRKFELNRLEREKARTLTIEEIGRTREICVNLYNDLQAYSRHAMLLRTDVSLGRKSNVDVALDISESQSSVIETYATARLYAPGPVSEASARVAKVVTDCPILDADDEFDSWSAECRRMAAFLLQVGETRIKELSGEPVAKGWYEHLVKIHPTRAELRGPKRVETNGRQRARAKVS